MITKLSVTAPKTAKEARKEIPVIVRNFMMTHALLLNRLIDAATTEEQLKAHSAVEASMDAQLALTAIELYLMNAEEYENMPQVAEPPR